MDRFSYAIFITNLTNNPLLYSIQEFNDLIVALGSEDLEEIRGALLKAPLDLKVAKHVIRLLDILWHYQ